MVELLAGLIIAVISLQSTHASSQTSPHIVVILADDLGWNDVSFHGSDQIPTPNIDALAYNGVILNSHYVPALCTPSRAALLTGKYPTTLGMQHLVILAQEPWGLPLDETLLPEHLRRNGYSTHAIGKWHLGFHKKEYTPLYRGFDTFYGYYNGYHDYYDHSMEASDQDVPQRGFDMRRGLDVDFDSRGKYSTDLFTEEAVNIIHNHNNTQGPMFLYLAHLAPHAGNSDKPYQAPDEDIARFSYIQDAERRVYAAMVHRMDQGVGAVVSALRATGKLDNSIILFMSDNGAVTFGVHSNHGSNYPLRGLKESPWEGGVRGVAALWSPLLNKTRRVSNQMMHSSDWLPTLLSAAGITANLGDIDGIDMWNELTNDLPSSRKEVFNNYDEVEDYSSLRMGPWKYIAGTAQGGEVDDWYGDSGVEDSPPPYDINSVLMSDTNVAISGLITELQLRNYPDPNSPQLLKSREALSLRDSSVVTCSARRQGPLAMIDSHWTNRTHINGSHTHQQRELLEEISFKLEQITRENNLKRHRHSSDFKEFLCDPREEKCLFHLEQDPCEELNLAHLFPQVVEMMEDRLQVLKRSVRPPLNQPLDPMADPALHDGVWTHWQEPERTPEFFSYRPLMFLLTDQMTMSILDNVLFKIVTAPIFVLGALVWQTLLGLFQTLLTGTCLIVVLGITLIIGNFMSNSQRQRLKK